MKERPILFQSAMVRAILAGTKTQTRRVAKGVVAVHSRTGEALATLDSAGPRVACPYGQPGDRLWVRESFSPYLYREGCWYWADGNIAAYDCEKPKPSIHMWRWASRITLEVTAVRVERLQDISIEDAKAEGAWPDVSVVGDCASYFGIDVLAVNPYRAFQMLWERINGPGSWDANPWVWCVEFKRLERQA